jgi:hypothetical protein
MTCSVEQGKEEHGEETVENAVQNEDYTASISTIGEGHGYYVGRLYESQRLHNVVSM